MRVETFTNKHYSTYSGLLKARNRAAMPGGFLPPTGIGIWDGDFPLAFGFLVKTDIPIASIGDLVTNPEAGSKDRDEALNLLLDSLQAAAKASGYSGVSAATSHRGLMQRYAKMGYSGTDQGLGLFVRLFNSEE